MSTKFTAEDKTHLTFHFWLVFGSDGGASFTRTEPTIQRHEHKMKMSARLPKSLWRTPTLTGTIVMEDTPASPIVIDVAAAQDALRTAIGVDIDLRVNLPAPTP